MNECMYEWMRWVTDWMSEWVSELMNEWMTNIRKQIFLHIKDSCMKKREKNSNQEEHR